jgi:phosphate/sulfate permease
VNWGKAADVGLGLVLSPLVGFLAAGALLLTMKAVLREPRLYKPPVEGDNPPWWVRGVLIATCGGVSFAHGSNDGQKGMGLILLVLIGFLPAHYALNTVRPGLAPEAAAAVADVRDAYRGANADVPEKLAKALAGVEAELGGKASFADVENKWQARQTIFTAVRELKKAEADESLPADARKKLKAARTAKLNPAIEFVPVWVVAGTALALGIGTTVGYKRIVVTVAEKIGKTHLTYAQGAAAESVAACTILLADVLHAPVSTTQVLSSGVAGTMAANRSGVQGGTLVKILLAWVMTLPACMLLAGLLFTVGRVLAG